MQQLKSASTGVAYVNTNTVEVVFGTPSKKCRGNGICRINSLSTIVQKKYPGSAVCIISVTRNEHLKFCFLKINMMESTMNEYFSNEFFILEESVVLPDFLKTTLELPYNKILPGKYPIQNSKLYFTVIFEQLH